MRHSLIRLRAAAGAFLLAAMLLAAPALAQSAKTYRVIGVGDMMIGSDFPQPILHPKLTPDVDPARIVGAELAALLRAPDVTFGNFEGTLHTLSGPSKTCRNPRYCYVFRSPPFYAGILKRLGFNLLCSPVFGGSLPEARGRIQRYREALETAGHDPATREIGALVMIYIGKTQEDARREFADPVIWYFRTF